MFTYRIKLSSKTRYKTFTYRNNQRLLQPKSFFFKSDYRKQDKLDITS